MPRRPTPARSSLPGPQSRPRSASTTRHDDSAAATFPSGLGELVYDTTGLFNFQGDVTVDPAGGTFVKNGTALKSAGTGTVDQSVITFTDNGKVGSVSGTIKLESGSFASTDATDFTPTVNPTTIVLNSDGSGTTPTPTPTPTPTATPRGRSRRRWSAATSRPWW